jgi:hypothetical protein
MNDSVCRKNVGLPMAGWQPAHFRLRVGGPSPEGKFDFVIVLQPPIDEPVYAIGPFVFDRKLAI